MKGRVIAPCDRIDFIPSHLPVCLGCRVVSGDELFTVGGQAWSWCDQCHALEAVNDAAALVELSNDAKLP